jgi:hypothetical protein
MERWDIDRSEDRRELGLSVEGPRRDHDARGEPRVPEAQRLPVADHVSVGEDQVRVRTEGVSGRDNALAVDGGMQGASRCSTRLRPKLTSRVRSMA